jgi:hypothetical protein
VPLDVKFAPLLIVFGLTAMATITSQLPATREVRLLGLLLDCVPLGGVVAATVIAGMRFRRVPSPLSRLLISLYGYFAGAVVGTLGVAHLVAVMIGAVERARQHRFEYDFRFYSLVLLGMLLIATGLWASIEAARLTRGDRAAWRASLAVWTTVLAINAPLIPLQRFAILFSSLAALALLLLAGMRRPT